MEAIVYQGAKDKDLVIAEVEIAGVEFVQVFPETQYRVIFSMPGDPTPPPREHSILLWDDQMARLLGPKYDGDIDPSYLPGSKATVIIKDDKALDMIIQEFEEDIDFEALDL